MISIFKEYIKDLDGKIGIYYKNLVSGEVLEINSKEVFTSASIIKIAILIETLRQSKDGEIDLTKRVKLLDEYKVGSSGVLNTLDAGIEVSIKDLYTLMIVVSDNTATNMLADIIGLESVNKTMKKLGYENIEFNRKMMDEVGAKKGIDNYVSPVEIADILEKVYRGQLINQEISEEIERVLKMQKVKYKIPYLLDKSIAIGHKTGENPGVTHDAGIIYTKEPFIFVFFSNDTNVIEAEKVMQLIVKELSVENSN